MDSPTDYIPGVTIRELVLAAIHAAGGGGVVSVQATIAAVRKQAPQLPETDCGLVAAPIEISIILHLGVAFDEKVP
ncbi:hypothetical protein NKJ26_27845 [Mesorhizobium sp. M0152]|uniref:hypothetical protein n=1 Tax=Mesorhizobium sp. M0152 TaxID=2956898 RepID=UPI003336685E